jgi:hypothetical protein
MFQTRYLLAVVSLLSIYAARAQTSSVQLAWNPSVGPHPAGYRIYDGISSHTYTNIVQVGNVTNATISGLPVGVTYFFSVTAYDTTGLESPFSNEISYKVTNSPPNCTYTLTPVSNSSSASGGTGSVTVTAGPGCAWSASSTVPWITVTSGATGTGSGAVNYSVQANTSNSTRTGDLTIAGESFTVAQAGVGCSYAIAPASASLGAPGGSGTASVTAGGGCVWTATSGVSWITINSGSSGTGNGAVTYTVAPNTSPTDRTGTLTIAGHTFTILEAAAPLDTTPPSVTLTAPANGSTVRGTISLTATASDNSGVTKVEFYCDGTVLEGTSVAPPYASLCDTTKLGNGKHSFNAKAYDAAGNWATSGSSIVSVRNHK